MEVLLLNFTRDAEEVIEFAGRVCHRSAPGNTAKFIAGLIKMGHESVLEHASATFEITGISRACSHQLVRHRLASFSQESQRYVDMSSQVDYVLPPSVSCNRVAYARMVQALAVCQETYKELRDLGIPKEDARFILPNATPTRLVMTANFRQWRHIISLRCAKQSQWEIQAVCLLILCALCDIAPSVFQDLADMFDMRGCMRGQTDYG